MRQRPNPISVFLELAFLSGTEVVGFVIITSCLAGSVGFIFDMLGL